MTLKRGFLKQQMSFDKQRLLTGVLLWLLISFPLYAFFYLFRESFRILSDHFGSHSLLVLSTRETYLYNLFYAALAVAIGFMFGLKFVLENSIVGQSKKQKYLFRRALNQQNFVTWSFLLWFTRVSSILGIFYSMFPFQYDLDFINDEPIFLISLPIVLFLSAWPEMQRALGRGSLKWFGLACGIFVLMSTSFAYNNFIDVEKINRRLLSRSVEYLYDLQVPKSSSHDQTSRKSLLKDLYMVKDTITAEPIMFVHDATNPIILTSLPSWIKEERKKLIGIERDYLEVNLHIDKDMPMEFVDDLKHELRKCHVMKIQYSTGKKYSKYPSIHPGFKYSGIKLRTGPMYFSELDAFLDSADQVDLRNKKIQLPSSHYYLINSMENYNRVVIHRHKNSITLNGQKVTIDKLGMVINVFVRKYAPDYMIIYDYDNDVTYDQFIECLDMIILQMDLLRNEMSIEIFGETYSPWSMGRDSVRNRYPKILKMWTREEKRLLELINRTNKVQ